MIDSLELTAIGDLDLLDGAVLSTDLVRLNGADDLHSLNDLAKDDVLAIEPRGGDGGDEELRAVGVGTSVGHREEAGASVLELEVLILELGAVDGLATSAVALGEVTTLEHEVLDDAVEGRALVVEGLAGLAHALLTCVKKFRNKKRKRK